MTPEMSMLLKTLQSQCNAENGRKALAIAKRLAKAKAVVKQHVPESDDGSKRSKPQSDMGAASEDTKTLHEEKSAKATFAEIWNQVQEFERNHPEAAADLQRFATKLGKMALRR
ncbi:hypothetical protein E4U21_003773 [Claviceps maximensis]|nr:hypothetical protein E4U21_003773 [Claviceps maximensis]